MSSPEQNPAPAPVMIAHAHAAVAVDAVDGLAELHQHRDGDGVAAVRSVEGDRGHRSVDVVQDRELRPRSPAPPVVRVRRVARGGWRARPGDHWCAVARPPPRGGRCGPEPRARRSPRRPRAHRSSSGAAPRRGPSSGRPGGPVGASPRADGGARGSPARRAARGRQCARPIRGRTRSRRWSPPPCRPGWPSRSPGGMRRPTVVSWTRPSAAPSCSRSLASAFAFARVLVAAATVVPADVPSARQARVDLDAVLHRLGPHRRQGRRARGAARRRSTGRGGSPPNRCRPTCP